MSQLAKVKSETRSRISPGPSDVSFISPVHSALSSTDEVGNSDVKYIPPWTEPYIIGVAGNSGSGKTSISQQIIRELNQPWTVLLSFDNFYRPLSPDQKKKAFNNEWDFDTPSSLDLDALYETVKCLKRGEKAVIPVYSFELHDRTEKTTTIYGANVIIIEGLYALYDQRLLDLMDIKIYVDTDLDICLARRLTRDILYRGRDLSGAMKQWETFVKPNAVRYLNPTMSNADLVIPRGLDNVIAINLMIGHIKKQLGMKSLSHIKHLKELGTNMKFDLEKFPNISVLPNNNQTKGINSILFDESTKRSDFIFYFDRMANLIIESAIDQLTNYKPIDVSTNKYIFKGLKQMDDLIAVTIIRSGDCFINSIKKTFVDIPIGKLLIQSDSMTGEPQLHTERLPRGIDCISNKKILLFDAQIISGAAAIMAIQVLLDHKVDQKDIIFCSYLSTEIGVRRISRVFPNVKLVVGKLSSLGDSSDFPFYNPEKFLDNHWHFKNRFVDSIYFGAK